MEMVARTQGFEKCINVVKVCLGTTARRNNYLIIHRCTSVLWIISALKCFMISLKYDIEKLSHSTRLWLRYDKIIIRAIKSFCSSLRSQDYIRY